MEEGAADRCKEAIDKALQYDEQNPEALQLMASYLFSIEKTEVQQDICGMNYPELPSPSHWITALLERKAFWAAGHYAVIITVGGEQLRGAESCVSEKETQIKIVCKRMSE